MTQTAQTAEQVTPQPEPGQTPSSETPQEPQAPETFEAWYEEQGDSIKTLVDGHISGLKSALESERSDRRDLAKHVKALSAKAEDGSELRQSLDTLTADLESAQKRADFYEAASRPEHGIRNLRLAWITVQADDALLDRRGNVDFAAMKQQYPELFEKPRQPLPRGNGGVGTEQTGTPRPDMNAWIRAEAGRG